MLLWMSIALADPPPQSTAEDAASVPVLSRPEVIRLLLGADPPRPEMGQSQESFAYQRLALPFDNAPLIVEAAVLSRDTVKLGKRYFDLVRLQVLDRLKGDCPDIIILAHWASLVQIDESTIFITTGGYSPAFPEDIKIIGAFDPVPGQLPPPLDEATHILTDRSSGMWFRKEVPGGSGEQVISCFDGPHSVLYSIGSSSLSFHTVLPPDGVEAQMRRAQGKPIPAIPDEAPVSWEEFKSVIRTRFITPPTEPAP